MYVACVYPCMSVYVSPLPALEQRKMSGSSTVFHLTPLRWGSLPEPGTHCLVEAGTSKQRNHSGHSGASAPLSICYVGTGIWTQILLLVQLVLLPTEPYPHHPKLKLYVFVVIEKTSFSVPLLCPCVTILDSCYVRSHGLHVMPFLFPPLWALKNSQMLNRTLYLSDNKK